MNGTFPKRPKLRGAHARVPPSQETDALQKVWVARRAENAAKKQAADAANAAKMDDEQAEKARKEEAVNAKREEHKKKVALET